MCRDLGKHWDLVVFNYDREYQMIQQALLEGNQFMANLQYSHLGLP